jgi:hypothetical protein
MTPYLDFTNDSIWTKTLGIFEGFLEANQALSVIYASAVEVSRLSLEGAADNHTTPYTGIYDELKLEALAQIPLTAFGTCKTLKITGTWKQPSVSITPITGGTPVCPLNPPNSGTISPPSIVQGTQASLQVSTASGAILQTVHRNLYVFHTPAACATSGRRYSNDLINEASGLDQDWELVIDLNDANLSYPDTYLELWFRLRIYNEPFNEVGLYVHVYNCAVGGLTEVHDVNFELTV